MLEACSRQRLKQGPIVGKSFKEQRRIEVKGEKEIRLKTNKRPNLYKEMQDLAESETRQPELAGVEGTTQRPSDRRIIGLDLHSRMHTDNMLENGLSK